MTNIPETGRNTRVQIRLIVIQVLVLSLLLTLGGRLWYLQIREGAAYAKEASGNHVQQVVQPAVRGSILDARGVALADNETRLVVSASRTDLLKMPDDGKDVLAKLAEGPGHDAQGGPGEGPAVRRRDAAALLERLAVPAHPHHRRGHRQAGPADPRARRGLPRHHRRAGGSAPLPEPRQGQHGPGPRLPLAGHRRGDQAGPEHQLAVPALRPGRPLGPGAPVRQGSCAARPASPATRSTTSAASSARPRPTRPTRATTSSPASTPACSGSPSTS